MNYICLIGRMTSDVVVKCNEAGTSKGQFTLAVRRKNAKEGTQDTDFINIVVWNKQAENLAKYTNKGSQIGVEGSLRVDNYTDRDGNKRTFSYVLANSIQYLSESKGVKSEPIEEKEEPIESFKMDDLAIDDSDLPF